MCEGDERWALVQRVAASRHLQKAPQLRDFLLYIARRTLAEGLAEITEQQIGSEVLGRRIGYSTAEDNIVRVQARHLRRKLEEYFSGEGSAEPNIIVIPKGTYVPQFKPRGSSDLADSDGEAKKSRRSASRWVAISLVCLAISAIVLLAIRGRVSNAPSVPATATPPYPWSLILDRSHTTDIVVADTCLVMLQDLIHSDASLAEYMSREYPQNLISRVADPELRAGMQVLLSRQYTSLADLNVSTKLLRMSEQFGVKAGIRYARHLNIREFKNNNNLIIVGSRRGIPWVELFEHRLNFLMERDPLAKAFVLRNKAPRPGEQVWYRPARDGGGVETTYAVVAVLPNLSATASVLVLAGITMEATEAAGELLTSSTFPPTMEKLFSSGGGVREGASVELLIKTTSIGGASRNAEIIAHRVYGAEHNGLNNSRGPTGLGER